MGLSKLDQKKKKDDLIFSRYKNRKGFNEVSFEISMEFQQMFDFRPNKLE
jgi:hypothetical protein